MDNSLEVGTAAAASLPELVYRQLRRAILNGAFAPGQMLRQEEVAAKMGVSRSPLREALPRLEAEGMVVLHPRRGYAVAELNPDEIAEVFDLRVILETELAARAIERRTETDIARVYALAGEMRRVVEAPDDKDAIARWFDLNTSFHDALLAPARCPHHMRALDTARGVIEAYIRAEVRFTGDLVQAQEEHSALAQAFVNGAREPFLALIRQHSYHTRDRLLAGLARSASASTDPHAGTAAP
jgi:DNA-binding GntR family transcriptional regulator